MQAPNPSDAASMIECDGGPRCGAVRHIHGCFADKGNCDHPSEHGSAAFVAHRPPPYDGGVCTRRHHVVSDVKIDPADTRLWACDCGCAMIGNARVEVRFGLLPHRFPEVPDAQA